MSAHCDDCGFDLPYEGDCLYCTARKRVAELEAALRIIAAGDPDDQSPDANVLSGMAEDALKGDEAK